jgi:hypothetical protein
LGYGLAKVKIVSTLRWWATSMVADFADSRARDTIFCSKCGAVRVEHSAVGSMCRPAHRLCVPAHRSLLSMRNLVDRSLDEVRVTAGLPPRLESIPLAEFLGNAAASAALDPRSPIACARRCRPHLDRGRGSLRGIARRGGPGAPFKTDRSHQLLGLTGGLAAGPI